MKDIVKFISEAKKKKLPLLANLYYTVANDRYAEEYKSTDVIEDIIERSLYGDKDEVTISSLDKTKIFKGYENVKFYGAEISDESGDKTTEKFFAAHGDGTPYEHITDVADVYNVTDDVQLFRYEDKENNILLIWSGNDLSLIYLGEK